MDDYLSVTELAAQLGIDPSAVRRRIVARGVPHIRTPGPGGGAFLVSRDQLDQLTPAGRPGPAPRTP